MTDSEKLDLLLNKVTCLETDVAELKSDVTELKSDVAVLKSDVTMLKSDMIFVKAELKRLHHEDALILDEVERVHRILDTHQSDATIHTVY